MSRYLLSLFFLLLVCLPLVAQAAPTIEVTIDIPDDVQRGDALTAVVRVSGISSVAAVDAGVQFDADCLRITGERSHGDLLPLDDPNSNIIFEETTENSTRLALIISDPALYADQEGVFYRVPLELTCDRGRAQASFTHAELLVYPNDGVESLNFSLQRGNLSINGIEVDVAGGPEPPSALTVVADTPTVVVPTNTATATATPDPTATATPTIVRIPQAQDIEIEELPTEEEAPSPLGLVLALGVFGLILLALFWWLLRRNNRNGKRAEES